MRSILLLCICRVFPFDPPSTHSGHVWVVCKVVQEFTKYVCNIPPRAAFDTRQGHHNDAPLDLVPDPLEQSWEQSDELLLESREQPNEEPPDSVSETVETQDSLEQSEEEPQYLEQWLLLQTPDGLLRLTGELCKDGLKNLGVEEADTPSKPRIPKANKRSSKFPKPICPICKQNKNVRTLTGHTVGYYKYKCSDSDSHDGTVVEWVQERNGPNITKIGQFEEPSHR